MQAGIITSDKLDALLTISPSQVNDFRDCPRKWAAKKIGRLKGEQNNSAFLGDLMHLHRERWLTKGIPPPTDGIDGASPAYLDFVVAWRAGDQQRKLPKPEEVMKTAKWAVVGLEHLPPPGLAVVEGGMDFYYPFEGGLLRVIGRVDFYVPNDPSGPSQKIWGEPGIPVVGDHKSTAGEQWVKTAESLIETDPQGGMYSTFGFIRAPYAREVQLHWSYSTKTSSPKGIQIRPRITREQAENSFEKVLHNARSMLTILQTPNIEWTGVEPNVTACGAYGGCPFRDVCPVSDAEKVGAYMSQDQLNQKLQGMFGNNGAATNGQAAGANLLASLGGAPAVAQQAAPAQASSAASSLLGALQTTAPAQQTQATPPPAAAAPTPPAQPMPQDWADAAYALLNKVTLGNAPATTQQAHAAWSNGQLPQAQQYLEAFLAQGNKVSAYLIPAPATPALPTPPATPALPTPPVAATPPPAAIVPTPATPAVAPQTAAAPTNVATSPVVPPDAPPADQQSTTPEEGAGKKKGGRPPKAAAPEGVDYTPQLLAQVSRLADVLERIAVKVGA